MNSSKSEFDNISKNSNPHNPYTYNYYDKEVVNTSQQHQSANDSFFKTNVNVNVNVTPNANLLKTVESNTVIKKQQSNPNVIKSTVSKTPIDKNKSMTMKKK